MLERVEANNDVPQILPVRRANHIRPEMTGKRGGNGHNFFQPERVTLCLVGLQRMRNHQRHMCILRHDKFLAEGQWQVALP